MIRATAFLCLAMLVGIDVAGSARGQGPAAPSRRLPAYGMLTPPHALLRYCCDAYCPKPLPCILPFCSGCGDSYCGKACPAVPCWDGAVICDDYCDKPCPDLRRPLPAHYFTCADGNSMLNTSPHAQANGRPSGAESWGAVMEIAR